MKSRSGDRPPFRGLGVELLAEWLLAPCLGGSIGVLEVALASELMARHPDPTGVGRGQDALSVALG